MLDEVDRVGGMSLLGVESMGDSLGAGALDALDVTVPVVKGIVEGMVEGMTDGVLPVLLLAHSTCT